MKDQTVKTNKIGWEQIPIQDFAFTTSGGTPKRSFPEYYSGNIPWVKSGDLNDGFINHTDEKISELGLKKSSAKKFPPGTLLVAMYGATIGRLGILNLEAATNQAVCGIQLPEQVDTKYLFYYLLHIRKELIEQGKGGAQPNINQQIIKETVVPLAPLTQQKRIVAKIEELFSHIDAGIEALKKAKQLLAQYRQSVLKAAVTGELTREWREANKDKLEPASKLLERILKERRQKWEEQQLAQFKAKGKMPKDDKWKAKYKEPEEFEEMPGEKLPNTWQWVAIGQVFDVFVGATPSRKKSEYWEGDINWVSSGEVAFCYIKDTKEMITQEGLENSSTERHPPGTVMLGMIGEGKTRGQAAILDIYAAHNQNTAAIEKIIPEQTSEYLYFYLMQQYELTRKRGSGNNQKALNKSRVQSIEFPLPPVNEQVAITELLMEKFSAIVHLEREIDMQLRKTEINKASVLASAFSGKIQ